MNSRNIAIIGGTGEQGFGLALRWAKAGEHIIIGSRQLEKAETAAKKVRDILGGNPPVEGMENTAAAKSGDVTVISVPFSAHLETLKSITKYIRQGAIIVDLTSPLSTAIGGPATTTLGVWEGSAAQQTAKILPANVKVVSAFHTLGSESLNDIKSEVNSDVIVCGDSAEPKRIVMELAMKIPGVHAVDGGHLENARISEQLAALLVGINIRYKTQSAGLRVTGIPPQTSAKDP